jgi:hypothetical protein
MRQRNVRLLSITLLVATPAAAAEQPKVIERADIALDRPLTIKMVKDTTLELRGVHGEITLLKAKGDDVTLSITRTTEGDEPRLEMLRHDHGVTVCTVYASPNPKKPNECAPGTKSRLTEGVKPDRSASIRLRADVPDGVHVLARLVLGNIGTNVGTGNLDLVTVNGNITISDNGSRVIQASAGKGDLDAMLSPADHRPQQRTVRLDVKMGLMRVAIPTTLPIRYHISSDKDIDSTFELEKPIGSIRMGTLGPGDTPAMHLSLDASGMFGRLMLRPRKSATAER